MSIIEKSQSLPASFTWAFPGSPIRVHLRLSIVKQLQEALETPESVSAAPPTVSGLLLGNSSRRGVTEVAAFEPMSVLDPPAVDEAGSGPESTVVGFYRSTQKGALYLTEGDLMLARTHFADPGCVVLLIEADESGPRNAAFFFWDRGEMMGDLALMEFPFDADQLALAEQTRAEIQELRQAIPVDNNPTPTVNSRHGRRRPLLFAGVLVLGGAAIYFYSAGRLRIPILHPPAGQAAAASVASAPALGLSVERRGADLLLSWNYQSEPVVNATSGGVVIHDGDTTRNVQLSSDQLRAGRILYSPSSDEVNLELHVAMGRKIATESITAVLPRSAAVLTSAQVFEVSRSGLADTARRATTSPAAESTIRTFSAPASSAPGSPAPTSLPEPPTVAGASMNNQAATPLTIPGGLPAPAAPPVPTTSRQAPSIPSAPVPLRQVMPRFPSQFKSALMKAVAVDVIVHINAAGKVIQAQAAPGQKASPLLIQAAVDAAREWTFQPAAVGGSPVSGEMRLKFNFTPR